MTISRSFANLDWTTNVELGVNVPYALTAEERYTILLTQATAMEQWIGEAIATAVSYTYNNEGCAEGKRGFIQAMGIAVPSPESTKYTATFTVVYESVRDDNPFEDNDSGEEPDEYYLRRNVNFDILNGFDVDSDLITIEVGEM